MAWFDRLRASRVRWVLWGVGMALLLIATVLCASWRAHDLDARLREDLLEQATALAQAMDPALVKRLSFTPADRGTPAYERLGEQLKAYGRYIPNRGIYTMALRDGQIVFGPESYPEGDPMASPPGTAYEEPGPEDFAIFQTGQPFTIGPATDEYGTFVSAIAPVFDPNTGQVLITVGIDLLAEDWARVLRAARWEVILGIFPAILLWAGLLAAALWRHHLPARAKGRFFHLETILVGILCFYASAIVALHGAASEQNSRADLFRRLAQARLTSVRTAFEEAERNLATLARYFESSEEVDRQEFAQFAQALAQKSAIEAYLWVPVVPAQERAAFEEAVRREGLADFTIWERGPHGELVPASEREVYYPALYAEPMTEAFPPLGFDLGSEPLRRTALEKALRTGLQATSSPLALFTEPYEEPGLILAQPVASHTGAHQTGFVVSVLRVQTLLESALRPFGEDSLLLSLELMDLEAEKPTALAAYPRSHRTAHADWIEEAGLEARLDNAIQPLFFADRAMALNIHPLPTFEALQPHRAGWLFGLAGLCFTTAVTLAVGTLRRRQFTLEAEVRARTIALEAERDRAQSYLDVVGVILLHIDREGRVTLINRRGLEILGCTAEEVIGKVWVDHFVPPEEREQTRQVLQALVEGTANAPNLEYHENAILTARGERRLIAWHNIVIRDQERQFQGILSSGEDITERRRAEEALRESEERHRRVSEMISDYAYAFRVEPNGTLTREWVIGGFERITGFTPEESAARGGWSALIYPPDMPIALARSKRLLSGQADVSEFRIVRKDGEIRWLRDYGQPEWSESEGRVVRIYGAAEDITARKRAEEERLEMERRLLQAQRLESLGLLAGGVAHDFNNLLMVISGNLDLALLDLPASSPIRRSIEDALQAARHAADLTRQLLAYAGKGRFTLARLNLNAFVEENAHLFRTAIPKTVTLSLNLAPNLPAIEADPGQIQQVVMNLLTNAAEAIGDAPGTIFLSTSIVEADAAFLAQSRLPEVPPPGRYVSLEVADSGCGMDEATLERIFEPFFSTKFTGRGLGMSAVAGIVRGHGGAILIQSAVGQGTTVRVLFPAIETEAQPKEPPQQGKRVVPRIAPVGNLLNRTALVVDDESSVRQVAEWMFRRMGFQTLSAASGPEALDILRRQGPVSIVLLDLSMPGMDGLTTLAEMRRLMPNLNIILSSGYNEQAVSQRFTRQGEAAFIQKPFEYSALRALVERLLSETPSGA